MSTESLWGNRVVMGNLNKEKELFGSSKSKKDTDLKYYFVEMSADAPNLYPNNPFPVPVV